MRQIEYIVLHCTATSQRATVKSILNYWKNILGWKSPGYHRLILPTGQVVQLAPFSQVTNGVKGYNSKSIHISYIGGINEDSRPMDNRTDEQKEAMMNEVLNALRLYPNAIVCGHRDFPGVKKACPSFSVKDWLKEVGINAKTMTT